MLTVLDIVDKSVHYTYVQVIIAFSWGPNYGCMDLEEENNSMNNDKHQWPTLKC